MALCRDVERAFHKGFLFLGGCVCVAGRVGVLGPVILRGGCLNDRRHAEQEQGEGGRRMSECFWCKKKLNSLEQAFMDNFVSFKKGIKIMECSECRQKRALKPSKSKGVKG